MHVHSLSIDCLISRLIPNFFLSEYSCTPTITIIITLKGATMISIKKSVGSLHANDETISIAATRKINTEPMIPALTASIG